jgi:hypothetical protein
MEGDTTCCNISSTTASDRIMATRCRLETLSTRWLNCCSLVPRPLLALLRMT